MSDRKIKKELNKELKPAVSADQFCLDAGITFEAQDAPKQKGAKQKLAKFFLPIAAVAAVSLSIVLPLTLGGNDETSDQPKYGENDVVYNKTTIENIYADDQIIMFNQSYVIQVGTTHLITPIEDSTVLGYRVSEVVYAEAIDGVPSFAFTFDFLVRCYDGYTVNNAEIYYNTDKVYTYNDISFNYSVIDNSRSKSAYISFKHGQYVYFIRLSGFGQITEIHENSVQLFLQKAFTEEKQNDETVGRRKVDS